jgi:hypothetical protein
MKSGSEPSFATFFSVPDGQEAPEHKALPRLKDCGPDFGKTTH